MLRSFVPAPAITLTTDFGSRDGYVGAMKGVILQIAPAVLLVDIAHEIQPQNRLGMAYVLTQAAPYFPAGTVHLSVVDPGVGTDRRPIALEGGGYRFVGPDNGTLSWLLADLGVIQADTGRLSGGTAVELVEERYRRQTVSPTFHGRDIFGPAAAYLATDVPLEALGPRIDAIEVLRGRRPQLSSSGISGTIIHIDTFGNAISNIAAPELPDDPVFEVAGLTLEGLAATYQEADLAAIVGSGGLVEIAARNRSASVSLAIRPGDAVLVRSKS